MDRNGGISGRKEGGNDDPLRPALKLEEMEASSPNPELCEWIRGLGKIRQEHPESILGAYRELLAYQPSVRFCPDTGRAGAGGGSE